MNFLKALLNLGIAERRDAKILPLIFEQLEPRWLLSALDPIGTWEGFIDKTAELATSVYTFGPDGAGNDNYYDGDFADFDGDGLMDRALIARYGLLWNTGDGVMIPVAGKQGVGQAPRPNPTGFLFRDAPDNYQGNLGDDGINFADIDNDGDYDVVSGGNGEVFAVQENGRGRFTIKSKNLNGGVGISAWQIVNTDLEGDGDVDLVVGSGFPIDFSLLVNDGVGNFTEESASRGLNFSNDPPEGHVSGDIDADGDYDLLLIDGDNRHSSQIGIIIARNDGSGNFENDFVAFARLFPDLPDIRVQSDSNQSMSLGDIDDDGDLDLVIAHGLFFTDHNILNATIGSHSIVSHSIWINDGGSFVEESAARWDVGNYSGEILRGENGDLVDIDYDGDLDFVALRRDTGEDIKHFQVYLNDGTGVFRYEPAHSVFLVGDKEGFGNDLDVTDLDGDGTYDIWLGMAGEQVRPLINTYRIPSGLPADMPRNLRVVLQSAEGVVLAWRAPDFATTARYYKVYRSTSPGLARNERELIKIVGNRHQDEAFAAPITRWTTTEYLNDPDVTLIGANDEIQIIDRAAQPGITYYYSIVHVGTENTASRPTPEIQAGIPASVGIDTTAPYLSIVKPTSDEWSQYPEIVVQYADGGSGIDLSSLRVSFDRPIGTGDPASGGRAAGADISDLFLYKDANIFIAPFEPDRTLATGTVTLSVTIDDMAGNSVTTERSFEVSVSENLLPTAVITTSQGNDPLAFRLSGADSSDLDGTVMRYEWYFPDGTTALGKKIIWRAPGEGTFEIELYVWDDRGGVGEAEVDMEVVDVPVLGDLDGDGLVGIGDLNFVLANWNQTVPPANAQADPSGDGSIGFDDLEIVVADWNRSMSAMTAPVSSAAPDFGADLLRSPAEGNIEVRSDAVLARPEPLREIDGSSERPDLQLRSNRPPQRALNVPIPAKRVWAGHMRSANQQVVKRSGSAIPRARSTSSSIRTEDAIPDRRLSLKRQSHDNPRALF